MTAAASPASHDLHSRYSGSTCGDAATSGASAVVLVTTIDIGNGEAQNVELRRDDSPERVARAFVDLNGLSTAVVGPLAEHLQQHLDKALQVRTCGGGCLKCNCIPARGRLRSVTQEVRQLERGQAAPGQTHTQNAADKPAGQRWHAA